MYVLGILDLNLTPITAAAMQVLVLGIISTAAAPFALIISAKPPTPPCTPFPSGSSDEAQ